MPIFSLYQNLVISHGRSDINMWLNIAQIALQLLVILLFYQQGITIMVIAYSAFNILWLGAWQPSANRLIGLSLLQMAKDVVPFMIIAAAVMIGTHYLTIFITNLWMLLLARIALAAILYYAIMRLLNVVILKECMQFLLKKK